jgi:hypothetical protein
VARIVLGSYSGRSNAPTVGLAWRGMFHPVVTQFEVDAAPDSAPFTTVMNWQAYEPVEFRGTVYGHKDVEFDKRGVSVQFECLPCQRKRTRRGCRRERRQSCDADHHRKGLRRLEAIGRSTAPARRIARIKRVPAGLVDGRSLSDRASQLRQPSTNRPE